MYESYSQDRINTQVIYRFTLAQVERSSLCFNKGFKQRITSLSLLAGRTVRHCTGAVVSLKLKISFIKNHSYHNSQ